MIVLNEMDVLDKLQEAVIADQYAGAKIVNKPKYHFDRLRMYFGDDYEVKGITISVPTIGDILEVGEERFYQSLSPFLCNSTSIRVMLWENNIDWNDVRDIEVFSILSNLIQDKEPQKLIFKNVNFDDFQLVQVRQGENTENEIALCSESQNILLYENDYMEIAEYIREMLDRHPKKEKIKGKTGKSWAIQEDKMNLQQNKDKETSTSNLLSLISTCVNHPGFKYKLQELREVGICQFMDSVKRIQKYESSSAALKGVYSGFVDASKMDKEQFCSNYYFNNV